MGRNLAVRASAPGKLLLIWGLAHALTTLMRKLSAQDVGVRICYAKQGVANARDPQLEALIVKAKDWPLMPHF